VIPELLTFAEADARLDGGLSARFQGSYETVLLFAGDVTFDGDLLPSVEAVAPGPFDLVAFAGDLAGIGGFRALRILDLSFNELRSLPEDLFTLPLDRLDLRYNRLDAASRARVREAFPQAEL
jgi:Leucine-rich repeat (LRR) protein